MAVPPIFPGAVFMDLGPDGGPYDETRHPKVCHHTTEGNSLLGAERAFAAFPPHLGYDPRFRLKHQYVRMDRHSLAFRGSENDDEYVFQVEIVGFAATTHTWPEQWYRNYGEDVIRPLRTFYGVPDQHLRFYRADEGIILARSTSPIRLSSSAFRSYSGHLGHQHVPAPDTHWDPGGLLLDKAIYYAKEAEMAGPSAEEIATAVWWRDTDPGSGAGENKAAWLMLNDVYDRTAALEEKMNTVVAMLEKLQPPPESP